MPTGTAHTERASEKFRLPSKAGQDPVKVLSDSGFAARAPVRHEDTWFERPQGAFLGSIVLRKVMPDGTWTMAWETTIRTGPEAERHHLWTEVDGERMWQRLQRLGMTPVLTLQGTRLALDKGPQHVAIERIKPLGEFLEVQTPARDRGQLAEIHGLLRRLGASLETRSYRDLAMAGARPTAG